MASKNKKRLNFLRVFRKPNLYNAFFIVLTLGIAAFTELFYHQNNVLSAQRQKTEEGFPHFRSEDISSIVLQNRVHILRLQRDEAGHWFSFNQEKKAKFPVREEFINSIISTLSSLTMQKQFPNNSLNRANFSLNEPLVTLNITGSDQKNWALRVGITNPVTKASYVSFNDSSKIFQVEMMSNRILNFHQEQVFDDRIFSFNLAKLTSMSFEWPTVGRKSATLQKENQKWVSAAAQEISPESINQLLKTLRSIKSAKVIQASTEENNYQQIVDTFAAPSFQISIDFGDQSYKFTGAKGHQREIASLLKSTDYYFVKEETRQEVFVMNRDDFTNLTNSIKAIK